MNERAYFAWVGVWVLLALFGCGMKTTYEDPSSTPKALNLYFNQKDLQILAETMVGDLLDTPVLGDERPVVRVSEVRNKTSEHIDTKAITDSIRTRMIRSGKVRFVSDVSEAGAKEQMLEEQRWGRSGLVDPKSALTMGKIQAARYHLYGELISITSKEGRYKERYYKFTLSLKNVETGILEWADEREILKRGKKRLVGW
jgi:uncharacterized protein (TIGR02722 family)